MEDETKLVDTTISTTEIQDESTTDSEQDSLKTELERVKKFERTELEKATYSLKKNAERVKELGGDPDSVLGKKDDTDDDRPVTLGMLKKMQAEQASKTAADLANDIPSETERELVKYHLANTIKSTGNPQEDLAIAQAIVNSKKNSAVAEEIARKGIAKSHSSASSASAKTEEVIEYTAQELQMMKPPFNLSKEDILKARRS